jgi:hypothetical protein
MNDDEFTKQLGSMLEKIAQQGPKPPSMAAIESRLLRRLVVRSCWTVAAASLAFICFSFIRHPSEITPTRNRTVPEANRHSTPPLAESEFTADAIRDRLTLFGVTGSATISKNKDGQVTFVATSSADTNDLQSSFEGMLDGIACVSIDVRGHDVSFSFATIN